MFAPSPMNLPDIFRQSFSLVAKTFRQTALIYLAFVVPLFLLSSTAVFLRYNMRGAGVPFVIFAVLLLLAGGAVVSALAVFDLLAHAYQGREAMLSTVFRPGILKRSARFALLVSAWSFVTAMPLVLFSALASELQNTFFGTQIPLLIMVVVIILTIVIITAMLRGSFALPIVVNEHANAWAATVRSWELTEPYKWRTFVFFVTPLLCMMAISLGAGTLLHFMNGSPVNNPLLTPSLPSYLIEKGARSGLWPYYAMGLVTETVKYFCWLMLFSATTVYYFDLRVRKEELPETANDTGV
jgi:hypothetical protein